MGVLDIHYSNFDEVSGSGLYINKECSLNLSNCIFSKCVGSENGGGLYLEKGSSQLKGVCFIDCKGDYGSSMYFISDKEHILFQISCFRCYHEKTFGDSVDLREGKYNIEYFNSSFSKSSQASVLQFAWPFESKLSYLLGANTEGSAQIELHTIKYPITFKHSGLINNTAGKASIYVNGESVICTFNKIIFSGNKNSSVACFSSIKNYIFEDCVYLDNGPFSTNELLPSGVTTQETEVYLNDKFKKSWCAFIEGNGEKTEEKTFIGIFLKLFTLIPFL